MLDFKGFQRDDELKYFQQNTQSIGPKLKVTDLPEASKEKFHSTANTEFSFKTPGGLTTSMLQFGRKEKH